MHFVFRLLLAGAAVAVAASAPAQDVTAFRTAAGQDPPAASVLALPARLVIEDAPLAMALERLQHTAGVVVAFSPSLLQRIGRKVTCICDESTVGEALDRILAGTSMTYTEVHGNIVVRRATMTSPQPRLARPVYAGLEKPIEPVTISYALMSTAEFGRPDPRAAAGTVTGRVVDASTQQPLVGANVLLLGTDRRTFTGEDGAFVFGDVPPGDYQLQVGLIGYAALEQTVTVVDGETTSANFALEREALRLDEVVVIGFGQKRRTTMTESVGTVSADEITNAPVVAPDHAIQGRISGVQVTAGSGAPGSQPAVRIRGVGTVGNTQPLYVVDGVPIGDGVGDPNTTISPLGTLNAGDIESISVLKDASAAAVYGVQAANGVVLIQTKRGRFGKPTIRYDGSVGIQRAPALWEMNSTEQYVQLTQDAFDNFNAQRGLSADDPGYLELHEDLAPGSRYSSINTDWVGDVVRQHAPVSNHNLSVSGATEQLNYFVSAGLLTQDATIDHYSYNRYSFRANTDFTINSRLRFGESFSVAYQELKFGVNGSGDGFLLRNAATMAPFYEIYDVAGSIPNNRYGGAGNLLAAGLEPQGNQNVINRIVDNRDRNTRILGSLHGEFEPIPGFTLRSQGAVDLFLLRGTNWKPGYTAEEVGLDRPVSTFGDQRGENLRLTWTNTAAFSRSFGPHNLDLLAGLEIQRFRGTTVSAGGEGFLSDEASFREVVKNAEEFTVGGGGSERAFLGSFGRVSYDYARRYLVTATVRRDGTSVFSPEGNRRWGTFPSVSAAWRIGEEPFFDVPMISELKLRGSWGQLGNSTLVPSSADTDAFGYPHIFRVSTTPDYASGETPIQAPVPWNFVNEDLIWETVETYDAGIELGLLGNRLSLGLTYYNRTTKDFLVTIPVPRITGFESAPVNSGSVLNRGIELEATYGTRVAGNVDLTVSANLTTVHNRLTSLAPGVEEYTSGDVYRTAVGYPIGYFYGYRTCGVHQTDAAASQALPDETIGGNRPVAGDLCFQDLRGPSERDVRGNLIETPPDGRVGPDDRTYLGKTIPDGYYGLNTSARYRRFDLNVFFQGVYGVQVYNEFRRFAESMEGLGRNQLETTQNRWTGEGTSSTMPRAVTTDPAGNNRFSDRWIEDGDYLRLRNVQLGYRIPDRVLGGVAKDVRVYVSASNLLTITGYSGLDPEIRTFGQWANRSQLNSGTDQGNVPQPRTFQIGLSAAF